MKSPRFSRVLLLAVFAVGGCDDPKSPRTPDTWGNAASGGSDGGAGIGGSGTLDGSSGVGNGGLGGSGGGSGGIAGTAGTGTGGDSGVGGSSGVAGNAGTGGIAGTGGTAGTSGAGGTAGTWIPWEPPTPPVRVSPDCEGLSTSCSLRSISSCSSGSGCRVDGDCEGLSYSCFSQSSHYLCIRIQGCVWNNSTSRCSGSAWSCSTFSGSSSCTGQPGCRWSESCAGVASSCSTLSSFSCTSQPGCSLGCESGMQLCSSQCVDVLDDEQHCGRCDSDCGYRGTCSSGRCECGAPAMLCGGRCLDVTNDDLNCGTCGNRCGNGYRCGDGACQDVDECLGGICTGDRSCTNTVGSYSCGPCAAGYVESGNGCADINECLTNNGGCDPVAPCINTNGSSTCGACPTGYTGEGATGCNDVDECFTNNNACDPLTTCTNAPGTYSCSACPIGYSGSGRTSCNDINECTTNNGGCHSLATCTNTPGSRTCGACPSGYTGDGYSGCVDENECTTGSAGCPANAVCSNTPGSYTCPCATGYMSTGNACVDRNECAEGTPCNANATCTNVVGSYECACNSGYIGNGLTCTDVNECATGEYDCGVNAMCINVPGTFACGCSPGYAGNGYVCTDIDECVVSNPCSARATCSNTIGSFTCTCNPGYSGNGLTCNDINECALGLTTCDTSPAASCLNTAGSYTCRCPSGYTGDGQGVDGCIDINECEQAPPCSAHASCTNLAGSYSCTCNAGYAMSSGVCVDINECTANTDGCDFFPEACVNSVGSFACVCPSGFAGTGIGSNGCLDINECTLPTPPCAANATCTNNSSSFTCQCNPGYAGDPLVSCLPVSYLTNLTVSEGSIPFDPARFAYILSVSTTTTAITVTPTGVGELRVNGGLVTSGTASASIAVNSSPTLITVTYQAQGGALTTYTITVLRGGPTYFKELAPASLREDLSTVALDGNTLAAGAPAWSSGRGAVHLYQRSGTTWSTQVTLTDPNPVQASRFGAALALQGNTLVVGAPDNGPGGSSSRYGRVHVFVRSNGTWTHQAELVGDDYALFGMAVALDGNTLAVGVFLSGVGPLLRSGRVDVFVRSGTTWTRQQSIRAVDGQSEDYFGAAVALSGNYLAVGASGTNGVPSGADGAGSVYVFQRSGTTWNQATRINTPYPQQFAQFGAYLALSGATLVIGSQGYLAPAVYTAVSGIWEPQATLVPSQLPTNVTITSSSLAIHGDRVVIGNEWEGSDLVGRDPVGTNTLASGSGAAWVFTRSGSMWTQTSFLKASNTARNASFGVSVAISADAVAIGASGDGSRATGVNGDQLDRASGGDGAAYVYSLP